MDNQETEYYKSVCYIQDKFIKGEISREDMEKERWFAKLISAASLSEKHYRYKKTGEIYNGQIYVNGECCTDGHGNEIIYS